MKRNLLLAVMLIPCGILLAQSDKKKDEPKSFIAVHGGVSMAMGAFGSTDVNNPDAGFGKSGFNLNISYGRNINKGVGIAAALFFNQNKINGSSISITDPETHTIVTLVMDHWQYYGVGIGPAYTVTMGDKTFFDIKVMGGIVNANAPSISVAGSKVTNDVWKVAGILTAGADCRIKVSHHVFVMLGAQYEYLDPKFKYTFTGILAGQLPSEEFHQKISLLNFSGGIGLGF